MDAQKAKRLVLEIRAFWRCFRGYCPTCNSDAPAIDSCQSCMNWRGAFPPDRWLAAVWLMRHFEPKNWSAK